MGQKVNPISFRVGINKDWNSKWFAKKNNFKLWLHEDIQIRDIIKKEYIHALISRIVIHRASNRIIIDIYSARPNMLSNKKNEHDKIKNLLNKFISNSEIKIDVHEIKKIEKNAQLVAENISLQLQRRIGFRRAMKRSIQLAIDNGVLGIKIKVSGRLGGSELARIEQYKEGKIPLHTISSNIEYGFSEAQTSAGKIGIKVWIYNPINKINEEK